MKLKRLIPSVLSLALVFSLAACGGDGGSANTPAQNETTPAQSETTPAQTEGDGSLQRVLDAGKLVIGAEGNWIPYVYNEDGTGGTDFHGIHAGKPRRLGLCRCTDEEVLRLNALAKSKKA